ncbi:MAG: geranylgeranylglycerol-phosphate geranylgeranyltransferase [Bacteroidales bacterium]|nr:geranylgeranylglycerol-phosphate geranylgeranyltransferase [Bacteroidales bacterium]
MPFPGNIKEFLALIRWKNLLIVVLTMILMRYAVIEPVISKIGIVMSAGSGDEIPMVLQFSRFNFILLVLATTLITAGGYVINDYFDIKTDLINRGKVIVGTKIPRREAMLWHSVFNIVGVLIGFYISWRAGYFWMGTLFLIVSGLLYFYSASYKRQFLIGNLVVAVLTAMVPLLVVLYEWPALYRFYAANAVRVPSLDIIFYWVGGFSLFAFFTTFTREIIKDIEDFEGDRAYGRNTVPVVMGVTTAKIVAVSLILITIILLYLVWYFFINDLITVIYMSVLIVLPLLYVLYRVIASQNRNQIHSASNILKISMLSGILYSILVKAILTWNLLGR